MTALPHHRTALAVACAALVSHARPAATQIIPPPRVLALPAPVPPPPPAPRVDAPERPWMRGQWAPHRIGTLSWHSRPARDPSVDEGALEERLAAVARSYLAWGRVDDELRWAPYLCRLPHPSRPRLSQAEGGGHAQKVYFLYARDRDAYVSGRGTPLQVVVKESWTHRPVTLERAVQVHATPIVARTPDGATVEPDRSAGLFVMMRVDRRDPRGDAGWAYGTVSADGRVTSAGRVASCMGCHVEAGPGRLFGLGGRR